MTEKKQLRQALNQVVVVGTLVEKNLESKEFTRQDGTKSEAMTGSISVRTGENEVHQIRFFANKFTKAGAENRQYKALQTVIDEYVSVADTESNPDAVPSKVRVTGKLALNEFYAPDGQLRQYQTIEGRFVNRLKEGEDDTPMAQFDTEGIVSAAKPEFDKDGEETDRAILELLIPQYNGTVIPYTFVVGENGKDFVLDEYTKGKSVRIYGDIVSIRKEHTKEIEMGFGANKIETTYEYLDEHLVSGGIPPYDEDSNKAFDVTLVKAALQDREVYLEGLKTRNQNQGGASKEERNTFGSGGAKKEAAKKEAARVDVSNLF
ncbi:hypothetical protein [Siminovitchia sp. 179-K 8D1 HS]|uniref:hypothetical protein n=1 Tax=Siminovitchia sp. 179-K 8D1 HS TaxID=3142385 RepID=UPI0039A03C7B